MNKREIMRATLSWQRPPYVPWSFGFTYEAREKLVEHYGDAEVDEGFGNHVVGLGNSIGFMKDIGGGFVQDAFGVVWDRRVDKDIGNVREPQLRAPTLDGYEFPDPLNPQFFEDIPGKIESHGDLFRVFSIGFSLYERAWTLRGMEDLLVDFVDHPEFVHELLNAIADYNIAQIRHAHSYDIDAFYFGDDWGQQTSLQMGPKLWREFIAPPLKRMYDAAHEMDRFVMIHSCGKVDELFDDLIELGVNCFNPFQPEVMDTDALMRKYHGRLSFHGGLSTQQTLPYGTPDDVRAEVRHLLDMGRDGGYVFSPAHAVEGDVPLENMVAFIEEVQNQ
jgi:uroporphyrinogen decarboxylase